MKRKKIYLSLRRENGNVKITLKTPQHSQNLIDNLYHYQVWNGDGTAHYGIDTARKGKMQYRRQLKLTGREFITEALSRYNVNHFHFRKATTGKINDKNIHFWKWENWLFAHNGTVGVADDKGRESEEADSLQLFNYLIAKKAVGKKNNINIKKICDLVGSLSFWGRLILINTETNSTYYFGDYKMYMLGSDILVVSSTDLNFGDIKGLYGIEFETDALPFGVFKKDIDGVFKINPLNRKFKDYDLDFGGRGYGYYNNSSKWDNVETYKPAGLPQDAKMVGLHGDSPLGYCEDCGGWGGHCVCDEYGDYCPLCYMKKNDCVCKDKTQVKQASLTLPI